MSLAVASRYARALADIVLGPDSPISAAATLDQIAQFEAAIESSAELRNVLLSPAVAPNRKRAVISRLASQFGTPRLIVNFLFVVIDRRRIALLGQIRQAFQAQLDERMGVARADVESARELSPSQRAALESELTRLAGKRVRGEFRVNPDLIGGAVARIGSTIYDGSVRGRLGALRRKLIEA